MKVLQINIFGNLSTGKIAVDIARTLKENGDDCVVAYARNTLPNDIQGIKIGNKLDVYIHGIMTRITDKVGFYSKKATKELLKKIDEYEPDIIHIHNLHGYYINIELLFNYIKEKNIPVVWTLHDCWAFTGHCPYFEAVGCDKWKTGCSKCIQKKEYPASLVLDNSKQNYIRKKELFTSIEKMVIVTPSYWLADLVKKSFLSKYQIEVIHNGIDLNVFKPTYGDWVKKYNLENKKIILGVAGTWSERKGLQDLVKLSQILNENYKVVVVGVSKKQKDKLPTNILAIERTYDSKELAEIYTAAEFFVNPTYEDNFPTVNIEALACGTPVITYNTGGSPEAVNEECGLVIEQGNITGVKEAIEKLSFDEEKCIEQANKFERNKSFLEYLYKYKLLN